MKKVILTLLIAFCAISLAVNAQNSSKLFYNTDDSPVLSEEIKAKLKANGIDGFDYSKKRVVRKQEQQPVQVTSSQPNAELKTTDNSQQKIKQPAKQFKTVEKSVISQENLKAKAKEMNLDFAKKGLPYKTIIKTVSGEQYIQIVDLPQQNGMNPQNVNQ